MRHRKSGLQLNRNSSNRKALFRNLALALIEHKVIKTTLPKAKELRRFVEPLVTLTKCDTVANRRVAYSRLNNKTAVGLLFSDIGKKSLNRPGGYTRIIKAGYRAGDNAQMAYIEFVDRHVDLVETAETTDSSQKTPTADIEAKDKQTPTKTPPDKGAKTASTVENKNEKMQANTSSPTPSEDNVHSNQRSDK